MASNNTGRAARTCACVWTGGTLFGAPMRCQKVLGCCTVMTSVLCSQYSPRVVACTGDLSSFLGLLHEPTCSSVLALHLGIAASSTRLMKGLLLPSAASLTFASSSLTSLSSLFCPFVGWLCPFLVSSARGLIENNSNNGDQTVCFLFCTSVLAPAAHIGPWQFLLWSSLRSFHSALSSLPFACTTASKAGKEVVSGQGSSKLYSQEAEANEKHSLQL